MKRHRLAAATQWITPAAHEHGATLLEHIVAREGIGRSTARRLLASLVASQWLTREGCPTRPRYRPGPMRQVVRRYALAGLQEDLPWAQDFVPLLSLPATVAQAAQHAFTELLNNAIDHSGGQSVTISVRQNATHLQMLVSDDGCGLFDRIEQCFGIGDRALAMLELSKGKLSTQPERHTGEGLFLLSRLADTLELHANQRAFHHRQWGQTGWHAGRPMPHRGTSVFLALALDTARTLDGVLRAHSVDQDYRLDVTRVPMRLLTGPQVGLASRAQARRATARLADFRRAELDFEGIEDIGPAFADELLRVFARAAPQVDLVPIRLAPRVRAMLGAVA